jgi:bacterioferritin-associated ferredoxin
MSTPQQIREALAAGNFAEAARLFDQFAHGGCDGASLQEARILLASALAARAHVQARLDDLHARTYVAAAYSTITPRG